MLSKRLDSSDKPVRVKVEGQLVEHGDLLSECKQAQEGLLGRSERERGIPNTLLITGSGVRVPHNPLMRLIGGIFADSRRYIRMN
jgi:hypothetical protein